MDHHFTQHLDYVSDLPLVPCRTLMGYQANELSESAGNGFIDLVHFNRIQVIRSHFSLKQDHRLERDIPLQFFGVNIFLQGHHVIDFLDLNKSFDIQPNMILLRKGYLGKTRIALSSDTPIAVLSLDFDLALLQEYDLPYLNHEIMQFKEGREQIKLLTNIEDQLLRSVQHILHLPMCHSTLDVMALESATLALLVNLLKNQQANGEEYSRTIINAMDILQNNLAKNIKIQQLSRLVGINECDLKRSFKEETGQTIGEYKLKLKMTEALYLLNQGQSIETISDALGYSSAYYFKNVFQRYFGHAPIEINR